MSEEVYKIKFGKTEAKIQKKYVPFIVGGVIALVVVASLFGTGILGTAIAPTDYILIEEFIRPSPPPPDQATGLCNILVRETTNSTYIDTPNGIDLYWYDNDTYYNTVSSNTTIILNASTIAVLNYTSYYPMFAVLLGSGYTTGDPYVNIMGAWKMAHRDNISASILSIDGNVSHNYVDNLTDGVHTVELRILNLEYTQYYKSVFGVSTWLPNSTRILPPITHTLNLTGISTWLTINGSMEDVEIKRGVGDWFSVPVWQPYAWGNTTWLNQRTEDVSTWYIKANWTGVTGMRLSDMFIDNVTDRVVPIP